MFPRTVRVPPTVMLVGLKFVAERFVAKKFVVEALPARRIDE